MFFCLFTNEIFHEKQATTTKTLFFTSFSVNRFYYLANCYLVKTRNPFFLFSQFSNYYNFSPNSDDIIFTEPYVLFSVKNQLNQWSIKMLHILHYSTDTLYSIQKIYAFEFHNDQFHWCWNLCKDFLQLELFVHSFIARSTFSQFSL